MQLKTLLRLYCLDRVQSLLHRKIIYIELLNMHDTTFSEGKNAVLYKSGLTLHGKIPCGIYVTLHATVNFTYLFMVYMFNNLKQLMELNFFWRIVKKNYTNRKQDSDNLSEVFSSCNF